ncbi:hypothetical protein [Haloarchaeobius sp. DYHT-AS-18]|uniref:hypothetical protein n=1 Tax=Haloarchaeobius sp. DYHT-AS-18 TaxID=3446117 RepID=UPI003EBE7BB3
MAPTEPHTNWTAAHIPDQTGRTVIVTGTTATNVDGGHYFGPGGFMEMRGPPTRVTSNAKSYDHETARRLWAVSGAVSEELTGVTFEFEETETVVA